MSYSKTDSPFNHPPKSIHPYIDLSPTTIGNYGNDIVQFDSETHILACISGNFEDIIAFQKLKDLQELFLNLNSYLSLEECETLRLRLIRGFCLENPQFDLAFLDRSMYGFIEFMSPRDFEHDVIADSLLSQQYQREVAKTAYALHLKRVEDVVLNAMFSVKCFTGEKEYDYDTKFPNYYEPIWSKTYEDYKAELYND